MYKFRGWTIEIKSALITQVINDKEGNNLITFDEDKDIVLCLFFRIWQIKLAKSDSFSSWMKRISLLQLKRIQKKNKGRNFYIKMALIH